MNNRDTNNITAINPNSLLGNARGLLCTNEEYHSGNVWLGVATGLALIGLE